MFNMIIWATQGKLEVEYCDYADQTGKNVYMIIWTTEGKLEVEYIMQIKLEKSLIFI